jgi:hypothetical protein
LGLGVDGDGLDEALSATVVLVVRVDVLVFVVTGLMVDAVTETEESLARERARLRVVLVSEAII